MKKKCLSLFMTGLMTIAALSGCGRVGNEEMLPPCRHFPQQQPENYRLEEQTQVC